MRPTTREEIVGDILSNLQETIKQSPVEIFRPESTVSKLIARYEDMPPYTPAMWSTESELRCLIIWVRDQQDRFFNDPMVAESIKWRMK